RPKWDHVNQILRTKKVGILAIQEAHLKDEDVAHLHEKFPSRLHILNNSDPLMTAAKGVAVIINKSLLPWKEAKQDILVPGRASLITIPWHSDEKLRILAVYAPNRTEDNKNFWDDLVKLWETRRLPKPDILLGDMNIVEDPIDRLPARKDPDSAVESLSVLKHRLLLTDGWRSANESTIAYSYTQVATQSRSRIDRIYVSARILRQSRNWDIETTGIHTDHKLASVEFSHPQSPFIGKGRWAIPLHCLSNKKLIREVREMGLKLEKEVDNVPEEEHWNEGRSVQKLFSNFKLDVVKMMKAYARTAAPLLEKKINIAKAKLHAATNETSLTVEERQLNMSVLEE
ncbi:DNase I-like protein, partial [Agrocybe pediades]